MLEQLSSVFFDEANELLDNLEEQLLALSDNPGDSETIAAVFRAMHTIKGSSAMFGFNEISSFTHEAESAMDQVRNGIIPVTPELITLLLKARDHIRSLLDAGMEVAPEIHQLSENLILEFKVYVQKNGGNVNDPPPQTKKIEKPKHDDKATTWRIKFRPSTTIMQNGTRPELLIKELTELGTATVVPFYNDLPPLSEMDSELCYFSWDVILTTSKTKNDIEDVFIFLDSDSKIEVDKIDLLPGENNKIGEILVSRKDVTQGDVDEILSAKKQLGAMLVDKKIISEEQVRSALAEQQHLKSLNSNGQAQQQTGTPSTTLRISSAKLDQLVDLVGELVTFNARLDQEAVRTDNPTFKNLSEQCDRIAVMMRDISMGLRMVPVGTLFQKFKRTVYDLSTQLGKQVEMVTVGAETELDKTVIEKLNDPLLHLIRNSVDHGIEMPAERHEAGKSETGTVTLSAKHVGAFINISIRDDGKGLDRDAIRDKAIQKGLIKENETHSDEEIFNLIFQPGFSTAKQVTSVSGRGVGLDVVKKDLATLGGTVGIESKRGKGTSFILKIPLTLAIIDGMLVTIGGTTYIIPLNTISECLTSSITQEQMDGTFITTQNHGKDLVSINLRKFFKIEEPLPDHQEIVSVYDGDDVFGLVVDKILGSQQTVIKPLGNLYRNCTGINSSTILGDGAVALILDVFQLTSLIKSHLKKGESPAAE
ncbi:MAG: chemotaxis protein CheA [Treponema sp.]|uniref:chemotaxis protein CheA n=1 Tax=Treponema sp. TaxID=166 RepID=UPI00257F11EB|nr:chemotaxis protein CheA [Treponema sp.]MBQ5537120.1 chemotaxis protein CheA [Treponema sp.]